MSRSFALPYLRTNPRTVRTAERRGWHVVDVPTDKNWCDRATGNQTSWLGLQIWTDRHSSGYWVSNLPTKKFAFENAEDASKFLFQWCL